MVSPEDPQKAGAEPPRFRRSRRRRRSRQPEGPGWRRQVTRWGVAALAILVFASGIGMYRSGWRGPRWLERWPEPTTEFGPWQSLEPGIDYARAHFDLPRPILAHALRIDLSRPDLEIVVPRAEYAGAGEVHAEWPMTWLRRHGLRAVINATPFSPAPIRPGGPTRLLGLAISNGERWSEPPGNLDNFVVTADGNVRLVDARLPVGEARQGAGGFLMIRRNDVNLGEKSVLDATTAVGVSADRRWLIWLVVDGGQPGYSEGVTQHEAADLIGQLGASDALRLDGGASSTLAVADGNWIRGGRVLNRSRNPVYDGAPRPVGNVIGVRRVP